MQREQTLTGIAITHPRHNIAANIQKGRARLLRTGTVVSIAQSSYAGGSGSSPSAFHGSTTTAEIEFCGDPSITLSEYVK